MSSPEQLIEVATNQLGFRSSPNNGTLYGNWYGLNYQPYSGTFISWCFSKIGAGNLVKVSSEKGFASCNLGYEHFNKNNQMVELKDARQGDLVFFSFFDDSKRANHVGIVTRVVYLKTMFKRLPVAIETIEANVTGELNEPDGVHSRTRLLTNNPFILGIARPNW